MIGHRIYARKDGVELGKCIGYAISSKGEMVYLIEGAEAYLVGTSKTVSTIRIVDRVTWSK